MHQSWYLPRRDEPLYWVGYFYMTYSEQLKSPLWQKKRLEVLQRDSFKCVKCNNDKLTLHVHHKSYVIGKSAWDYPIEYLETLCENCHKNEHFVPDIRQIPKEDLNHKHTGHKIQAEINTLSLELKFCEDEIRQTELISLIRELLEMRTKLLNNG